MVLHTSHLRPNTQREVLVRQPRTFQEAENAARLTQTVQQSIQDAKGTDVFSRMQQQLDTLFSSLETKEKLKEGSVSAHKFSPQTSVDEQLANLRRDIKQVMTLVSGQHMQDSAIAAYQPSSRDPYGRDSGQDEISRLREENREHKAALREPQPQRI